MSTTDSASSDDDVIDAVVTWVDGSDPRHAEKKRVALEGLGQQIRNVIPAGIDITRFSDNNEIEYCIRSIRKFAPWIRTIFLVTDDQCPAFLTPYERQRMRVTLVDHREIFAGHEDVLPTFNSLSIETVLHRIPGLAKRFLYFNDDFILLQPVRSEDFFRGESVVLRGAWSALPDFGPLRIMFSSKLNVILKKLFGINRAMSVLQQIRAAQLVGFRNRYFKVAHAPYPLKRPTIEAFFGEHPDLFRRNIEYRFRSLDQYATTVLTNHIEMLSGTVLHEGTERALMICFNRDWAATIKKKMLALERRECTFFCVQSLEEAQEKERQKVLSLLETNVLS